MDASTALEILTRYNAWRRWDSEHDEHAPLKCPHPREIGLAIDFVINNWGK